MKRSQIQSGDTQNSALLDSIVFDYENLHWLKSQIRPDNGRHLAASVILKSQFTCGGVLLCKANVQQPQIRQLSDE